MQGFDGITSNTCRLGGWSSINQPKSTSANLVQKAKSVLARAFAPQLAMAVA